MESLGETCPLIPGKRYVIVEPVVLEHTVGPGKIAKLSLKKGDVITVQDTDSRYGLSFSTPKYSEGLVIVSPKVAASISVETS